MDMVARAEETKRTLRDLYSPVTIHVEPANATVLADGVPIVPGLDLGMHHISVRAAGFEPQEKALDIPGKIPVELSIVLKRVVAPARLSVVTETSANIDVDGKKATGQWEGPVAPGKHTIQVTAQGKIPYFTEIELGEGANRSMLVPLKERGGIPVWVWIGGSVLLAGGVALAAFGIAKSTEQPPPLTGKLGTIDLSHFP
jgi:hypothetical protein